MNIYNFKKDLSYKSFTHIVIKRMRHNKDYIVDLINEDTYNNFIDIKRDVVFNRNANNETLPIELHISEIECLNDIDAHDGWLKDTIKVKMDQLNIPYSDEMLKADLLARIDSFADGSLIIAVGSLDLILQVIDGAYYLLDGTLVNIKGEPLDENGEVIVEEEVIEEEVTQ